MTPFEPVKVRVGWGLFRGAPFQRGWETALTLTLFPGERIPRTHSRFEPLNRALCVLPASAVYFPVPFTAEARRDAEVHGEGTRKRPSPLLTVAPE